MIVGLLCVSARNSNVARQEMHSCGYIQTAGTSLSAVYRHGSDVTHPCGVVVLMASTQVGACK
jgi:hypothetical protein